MDRTTHACHTLFESVQQVSQKSISNSPARGELNGLLAVSEIWICSRSTKNVRKRKSRQNVRQYTKYIYKYTKIYDASIGNIDVCHAMSSISCVAYVFLRRTQPAGRSDHRWVAQYFPISLYFPSWPHWRHRF